MKIVNKEKTIESVNALVAEINSESKNKVEVTVNEGKEENGSLWFTFEMKSKDKFKAFPVSKVGLYIFESTGKVSSFIINGRTMKLLFENATILSPDIAIHYLKSILLREIEWTAKLESRLKEEEVRKAKKRSSKGRGNNRGGYNKGGEKKSSGKKPQGPGKPSRQFRGNSSNSNKKPYHESGDRRSRGSSSGINIRTTKHPYKNSNN